MIDEIIDQLVNENPELNDNYDFIKLLFNCVFTKMQWAESIIKYHLENWEPERVALIDKILLKMGICEIYFIKDIPPKVTISEMVEIKKFIVLMKVHLYKWYLGCSFQRIFKKQSRL